MPQVDFEVVLKSLMKNRYKEDLHSAVFRFDTGTVAFIEAHLVKYFTVIVHDESVQRDFNTVEEVLNFFEGRDETLVQYEL